MRILFVHEVNYLSKPIFEMHEFPEHLSALGHEVGFWHFPEGYSKKQIAELGFKRTIQGRVLAESRITLFTPQESEGNLLGRLKTAISSRSIAQTVLSEFKPDVIISFSVPTQGWQCLRAAKREGIPFIFRALDVSHQIRKGPFPLLIRAAEKFLYRNSDFVSGNNVAMLEYCQNLAGRKLRSAAVHYPPLDLTAFRLGSRSRGRTLLGLSGSEQIVMYMGSFFYFSGLPEVIRSMALAPKHFKLVLVGGGEQEDELRRLVIENELSHRVQFAGFIPFAELPHVLAAADIAINPMHRGLVSNAALPNKVLQYLACHVPVASTKLDGLLATFGKSAPIFWVDSPEAVVQQVIDILDARIVSDFSKSDLFLESLGPAAVAAFERMLREVAMK